MELQNQMMILFLGFWNLYWNFPKETFKPTYLFFFFSERACLSGWTLINIGYFKFCKLASLLFRPLPHSTPRGKLVPTILWCYLSTVLKHFVPYLQHPFLNWQFRLFFVAVGRPWCGGPWGCTNNSLSLFLQAQAQFLLRYQRLTPSTALPTLVPIPGCSCALGAEQNLQSPPTEPLSSNPQPRPFATERDLLMWKERQNKHPPKRQQYLSEMLRQQYLSEKIEF